jgi:putative transposase
MPRHPRVHAQGLLDHVMARGNDGRTIFANNGDYEAFLEELAATRKRYPFYLYAYILMSNNFHLLLEVQQSPTGRVLQSLLTGYAGGLTELTVTGGIYFKGATKRSCAIARVTC